MTASTNFLQPIGFKIAINRERFPTLEYMVQSVDHPGINALAAPAAGVSRIEAVHFPADKLEFGEVTFNVLLDEELQGYSEMYLYLLSMVNEKFVPIIEGTREIPADMVDITLSILTSANNIKKNIVYHDCVPTLLGNINFEASAGSVEPLVFPISFKYTYFDVTN